MSSHSPTEAATHIAGDWGTTHLRLHLCRGTAVLDKADGPGIGALTTSPETILFDAIRPWSGKHGALPIWLAGMVGSRNGWREVPYASCPADIDRLRGALLKFRAHDHEIAIAAGASCTNRHGAPDVMRGEETQVFGALKSLPAGGGLICLPGTHSKWATVEDDRITGFATHMTGEVFDVLRRHSILGRLIPDWHETWRFDDGIDFTFTPGTPRSRAATSTGTVSGACTTGYNWDAYGGEIVVPVPAVEG